MNDYNFVTLEKGNNEKVKIEYTFLENYCIDLGLDNVDEFLETYTWDQALEIEGLYLDNIQEEINSQTSNLYNELSVIKNNKENKLFELGNQENGIDTIEYAILEEEIEDVKYAIDSLSIEDEIERNYQLSKVISQTTSGSILDALNNAM